MMFEDLCRFKEWMNVAWLRIVVFGGVLLRIQLISSASVDIGNPCPIVFQDLESDIRRFLDFVTDLKGGQKVDKIQYHIISYNII